MKLKLNSSTGIGKTSRGIGLIEVLIAVFVLAVGAVALTKMHSAFFETSASSKARAEAMALAQDRIENRRNYLSDVGSRTEFETFFPLNTTTTLGPFEGVNANFALEEIIGGVNLERTVTVNVSWDDAGGDPQSVTLDTEFAYAPPYIIEAQIQEGPLSPYPTGRARLGEGTIPAGETLIGNNDGTSLFVNPSNPDNLLLIAGDDTTVVLTLVDACVSGSTGVTVNGTACTDFVRISGTVYIDTDTSGADVDEVFVLTSNAGYCTRYDNDGNLIEQASDKESTQNGDYDYFNYTCYLGGGWRGNVGILLDGGIGQRDRTCLGDPNSLYARNDPAISLRRNYSGMKYDDTYLYPSNPPPYYYSQGIKDAAVFNGHDFVIAEMAPSTTEDEACVDDGILVRGDSTFADKEDSAPPMIPLIPVDGYLFRNNPGDFFCLNDNGMIDTVGMDGYLATSFCPYDPSRPPIARYEISGLIDLDGTLADPAPDGIGDEIAEDTADLDDENRAFAINTTDGPGNCSIEEFGATSIGKADYLCYIYDAGTGWNGGLLTSFIGDAESFNTGALCSPDTGDASAFSNLQNDELDNDFICSTATLAQVSGTVTQRSSYSLDSAFLTTTPSGVVTPCVVTVGTSYVCTTPDLGAGNTWSGTITFVPTSGGKVCATAGVATSGNNGVATFSAIVGAQAPLNVTVARASGGPSAGRCP